MRAAPTRAPNLAWVGAGFRRFRGTTTCGFSRASNSVSTSRRSFDPGRNCERGSASTTFRELGISPPRIWPPAYLYTYKHQWQKDAFQAGKQLHEQIGFDIVHQLTYVGFRVPGCLWKLGLPFVWGPIGGLEQTTWSLIPSLGLRGGLHSAARNLFNEWDRRFAQLPKQAFAAADGAIIAATRGIQREIHRFYRKESSVISEIGLPPITQKEPCWRPATAPLHLLWCGNLNPRKALPFLFSAL